MKNKNILIITAIFITMLVSNNFAQWESQVVGTGFLDIQFLNENVGWGVGGNGEIWKSINGGLDWSLQTSGTTAKLVSLDIINSTTVIAVGDTGTILKTVNGGSTWNSKNSGTTNTLRSVHFINSNKGFAAGYTGTILKTEDAGETWTDDSWPADIRFESVVFSSSDIGWIGGRAISLKTTDGGDNWQEVTIKSNVYFFNVFFLDLNNGWAVGADQNNSPNNGILVRTVNGGDSWTTEHNLVGSTRIRDVNFVDESFGWLVGDNGQIFSSTDGGNNWVEEITVSDTALYGVHFYNENLGWAAGSNDLDEGVLRIYDNTPEQTSPNPATNLVVNTIDEYSISLTWQDNSDNEIGFIIERKLGTQGTFEAIDTAASNIESYTNTGLIPDTEYCYRIIVYNNEGANSDWNIVCSTTDQLFPPQPATNLTAIASGDSVINLSWTDNADNEEGFIIQRKIGTSGTFASIDTLLKNSFEYPDISVSAGTEYCYQILVYNSAGMNSDWSVICATTEDNSSPPLAPTNISALAIGDSMVTISWADNSNNESAFQIRRKFAGGGFEIYDSVDANIVQYVDTTVSAEVEYCYQINAIWQLGVSISFEEACATPSINLMAPDTPLDLTTLAEGDSVINLTWMDNSNNENGFIVQRKIESGGTWLTVATISVENVNTYRDNDITAETQYCYQVSAYNNYDTSAYSNESCSTANSTLIPPIEPSNLSASAEGDSVINLTWIDNSNNEVGFIIQRKIDSGGTWLTVATISTENVNTYGDNDITSETQYCYQVSAYNNSDTSTYSNESCATANSTLIPPIEPSNLSASAEADSLINLIWVDNSSDEDGFKVERKVSAGSWSEIADLNSNLVSYKDRNVVAGSNYCYRVYAYNSAGNSENTAEACETPTEVLNYPSAITVSMDQPFGSVTNANNYRMIGIPGNSNIQISNVISGTHGSDWNAYYDNGNSQNYLVEYNGSSAFTFSPGKGFWIISKNNFEVNQNVSTVQLDNNNMFSIPLPNATWNIISNPFESSVSWSDIKTANSLSTNQVLYSFSGGFSESNSFEPYTAYYFMNSTNLSSLKIPYSPSSNLTKKNSALNNSNSISLKLKHGGLIKSTVHLGLNDSANEDLDDFDRFAPPGDFTEFNLTCKNIHILEGYNLLMGDIRNYDADGHTFEILTKSKPNEKVILDFEFNSLSSEFEVYLIDNLSNVFNLRKQTRIDLSFNNEYSSVNILIGKQSYIDKNLEELTITDYRLAQNYPNPFNPTTNIKYSIPIEGNVKLFIYDVLGKEVIKLVDEYKKIGNYEYNFVASNLTSGVYFYTIRTDNYVKTRKMILLK